MKDTMLAIEEMLQNILPWSVVSDEEHIKSHVENSPSLWLKRFYVFPLTELAISGDIEDIPRFINERYLNVLTASHRSRLTLMTAIVGNKGKTQIFVGFLSDEIKDPYVFQKVLEGVLPGVNTEYRETLTMNNFLSGKRHGGLISGIPTLKIDDEKQRFNLSSIVRSMYGENYSLFIISKPVDTVNIAQQFQALLHVRDECHALANRMVGQETGESREHSTTHGVTKGTTTTQGTSNTLGASIGGAIPTGPSLTHLPWAGKAFWQKVAGGAVTTVLPVMALLGLNIGRSWSRSEAKSTSVSESQTAGRSESRGESLSYEQQFGLAVELEKIAENFIERLKKGMNVGYWETAISFATETEAGKDILGGSFLGELAKPSVENFPAKLHSAPVDKERIALIPTNDSISKIFPASLHSYITSEELSLLASPPTESLPGYEIKRMPLLSLTDIMARESDVNPSILGNIADHGKPLEESVFSLSHSDLVKHTFVSGITGSGKTTTVKEILKHADVPFLVIESSKRDYRQLLGDDKLKDRIQVYTIGDATVSPIRINPFYILPEVSPLAHIDYLKAIFNASFSLYGPMPHILEKCLHNIYIKRGWNLTKGIHPHLMTEKGGFNKDAYQNSAHVYLFPTLDDLKLEINEYVKRLDYKGELSDNIRTAIVTRLESLCVGAKGFMFNTYCFPGFEDLLNSPTIFEIESLSDDDDKAFFVGLMLTFISEYRQRMNPAINPFVRQEKGLKHLLVIEEAHRLLKNVETERSNEMLGNPKGKAVEFFCNILAEMRSTGQGVIVVEQIPSKISPDVVKNTNTKIVHRLVAKDDQLLLSGSLCTDEKESLYFSRLKTGFALCHKEGMEKPLEIKVKTSVKDLSISDEKIQRKMMNGEARRKQSQAIELNEFSQSLNEQGNTIGLQFFNSLLTIRPDDLQGLLSKTLMLLKATVPSYMNKSEYNEQVMKQFLFETALGALSQGVYCKNAMPSEELINGLYSCIIDEKAYAFDRLKSLLAGYWGVPSPENYLTELVSNLILHLIKNSSDNYNISNYLLANIISGYFIPTYNSIVLDIRKSIKTKIKEMSSC